jgi:hypothetical protein
VGAAASFKYQKEEDGGDIFARRPSRDTDPFSGGAKVAALPALQRVRSDVGGISGVAVARQQMISSRSSENLAAGIGSRDDDESGDASPPACGTIDRQQSCPSVEGVHHMERGASEPLPALQTRRPLFLPPKAGKGRRQLSHDFDISEEEVRTGSPLLWNMAQLSGKGWGRCV